MCVVVSQWSEICLDQIGTGQYFIQYFINFSFMAADMLSMIELSLASHF
jgi:hypothetical protein